MASPNLPTGIDSTYPDDAGDESVKAHQEHHDVLHGLANSFDMVEESEGVWRTSDATTGDVMTWTGSLWAPSTVSVEAGRPDVVVASSDMPAAIQDSADYVCDGVNDEVQINLALVDAAPITHTGSVGTPSPVISGAQQRAKVSLTGGRFVISNPIRMPNGTHLEGQGYLTELYLSGLSSTGAGYLGTDAEAAIQPYETSGASTCHLVRVSHLWIKGTADSVGHGIHFWGGGSRSNYPNSSPDPQVEVHDVWFDLDGGTRHGVWLSDDMRGTMIHNVNGSATGNSIWFSASADSFISNCHVHSAATGYAGFFIDGSNIRLSNCKAYYAATGFRVGARTALSSCEAQDVVTGFHFTNTDAVGSALVAENCQADAILINSNYVNVQFRVDARDIGSPYTPCTNGVRMASAYTDCQLVGGVRTGGLITNPTSGTFTGARNFVRISTGTTLLSVG